MISTVAIQASPFSLPAPDVALLRLPREQRPSISIASIASNALQLHALTSFFGICIIHFIGGKEVSVAAVWGHGAILDDLLLRFVVARMQIAKKQSNALHASSPGGPSP